MIALTGMYRGGITYGTNTVPDDWWSYFGSVFLEFATDNAYDRRGDNSTFNKLTDGTLTANNNVILGYWKGSFKRIAITNDFIENIGKVPTSEAFIRRLTARSPLPARDTVFLYVPILGIGAFGYQNPYTGRSQSCRKSDKSSYYPVCDRRAHCCRS